MKYRDAEFKNHLKKEKEDAFKLREEIKSEREKNSTGFFRVNLVDSDYKWEYRTDKIVLKANTLDELEKMVLSKKLEWKVLDSGLASVSRKNGEKRNILR